MLTPQDKSKLSQWLAFKAIKTLWLAALLSVLSPSAADAQVVSKKDVKKSHEQMIKSQENYFNDWAAYIEWEWVREFFAKEIAKYKADDKIFDSKVLTASESKDPVLKKKEIVDKALHEAMKLFKKDLENWVIWFNKHIADENNVHAVKWGKADRWYGDGHSSHGCFARVSFFQDNVKAFGKKGAEKKSSEYNKFLDGTFKWFKSGAEWFRNGDVEYAKWLATQTAVTYKDVEDQTKTWLEGIYDVINGQVFSTKNHVPKKK
jgi:hypothetical protein